jgi:broad specificity phosphatase PhoE
MAFIRSFSDLRALTLLAASLLLGHAQITMAAMDQDQLVDLMQSGGAVLMIRHALAPGTGDPDHFKIGDCSTQRNLNEEGRRQASDIGDWLRVHGIQQARVYSSQWCRCLDTARLLKMGSVNELPALNSFYERPEDREPNLAALRAFIVENTQRGQLIILVTHQVTISGITNEWTDSGHAKLVRLDGDGHIVLQGSLAF